MKITKQNITESTLTQEIAQLEEAADTEVASDEELVVDDARLLC